MPTEEVVYVIEFEGERFLTAEELAVPCESLMDAYAHSQTAPGGILKRIAGWKDEPIRLHLVRFGKGCRATEVIDTFLIYFHNSYH